MIQFALPLPYPALQVQQHNLCMPIPSMRVHSISPPCPSLLLLWIVLFLALGTATNSHAQSSQSVVPTLGQKLTEAQAAQLANLAFAYVFSGHYEGEHWLGSLRFMR
jgi:hypothetical protein